MRIALPPSVFDWPVTAVGTFPLSHLRPFFYCCDSVVTPQGHHCTRKGASLVLVPVLPSPGTRLVYLRCFRTLLPLALVLWSIPLCAKPGSWIETNACATPRTSQVVARGTPSYAPTDRVSSTLLKVNRDHLVTPW